MANLFADIEQNPPRKAALIYEGLEYSYAYFLDRIDTVAGFLLSNGASGERVGIGPLSKLDFLAAVYGCAKAGASAVAAVSTDPLRNQGTLKAANARIVLNEIPAASSSEDKVKPNAEAMVIFTSGTTSEGRKGVILGHEGISTTAEFMNRHMGVDSSIRECVYAPLDHAFAFGRCHAVLMARGTIILDEERLTYDHLFNALSRLGANALSCAPSVLASILKIARKRLTESGSGLRWIQTGAMRFDPSFRNLLCDAFPNAGIFLHYGLSEAMRVTFMELHTARQKLHTEGKAADGVHIGIFGANGERLGVGEEGTIAIQGRNLALGYLDRKLWEKSYRDGWFFTADRGMLDEDGYLVFAGRADDVINANGHIVHPDEIESRLQHLFPAQSFSVLGVPDPKGIKDKIIVLAVEGDSSVTASDVAQAMPTAESFMVPRLVLSVEKLPRTRSGKIARAKLAIEISGMLTSGG